MALITSDFDAMRYPARQMALITSDCAGRGAERSGAPAVVCGAQLGGADIGGAGGAWRAKHAAAAALAERGGFPSGRHG